MILKEIVKLIFTALCLLGDVNPSLATCSDEYGELVKLLPQPILTRSHPDAVDVGNVKVGDAFFVTADVFHELPNVARKVDSQRPHEVRVVGITTGKNSTGNWRNDRTVVFIESPATGRVGVARWALYRSAFQRADFQSRSPFEVDEFVQIGHEFSTVAKFEISGRDGESMTFEDGFAQYLGKFKGYGPGDKYLIEIQARGNDINSLVLEVPSGQVHGLAGGTDAKVRDNLKTVLNLKFSFKTGEVVRFRNSAGFMQSGTFLRDRRGAIEVRTSAGQSLIVSEEHVFKHVGGTPRTPIYNADWINAKFAASDPLVARFLNGAAKVTSHPDFAKLAPQEKIKLVLDYTQRNVPYKKAAVNAENAGLTSFNDLVCAGLAVCRHNSPLLATALAEAGYSVRLVQFLKKQESKGHVWLEVDLPTESGKPETYVVDPSNGQFIEPIWKVQKAVREQPTSFEAQWYTQPGRLYEQPQQH